MDVNVMGVFGARAIGLNNRVKFRLFIVNYFFFHADKRSAARLYL